jgi:hypothetical protein
MAQYLIGGVINGAILSLIAFLLSRFAGDIYGRALLVIFLFIATGVYVGFAVSALVSGLWVLAQVAHVIVLGSMGLLGLRGSPYWIATGWTLHVLWDYPLHYLGPGHAFAPAFWAISCVAFDLVIALYVVVAYRLGWVGGGRRPAHSREVLSR